MPILSRRSVLGASIVVVAGGAGVAAELLRHPHRSRPATGAKGGSDAPTTTPPAAPTAPALQKALTREQALLARLTQAATAAPSLASVIGVLRADHRAHADALADLIVAAGVTPTSTPPTPTAPASASASAGPPTVAELVRWEKSAATSFAADFDGATGAAAAVLASIYACEQTHVAWLA